MPAIIYCLALLAAIYALPEADATPTKCEFIAVELMEAVDQKLITHQEAMDILKRCASLHNKYSLVEGNVIKHSPH